MPDHHEPLTKREVTAAFGMALGLAVAALFWSHTGSQLVGPMPYGNDGACDVWQYYGLIRNPGAGDIFMPHNRIVGRVMYFGPLYPLKLALPAVDPTVLSYFAYAPATLALLYLALRAWFSSAASMLSCLLVGLNPIMLTVESQTYPPMGCLAYTAGMLAALCWAARLRARGGWAAPLLYMLAGAAWSFSLNANLISLEYNFFCFGLVLLGQWRRPFDFPTMLRDTSSAAAYVLIGALVGTAIFIAFGLALGISVETMFLQVTDVIVGMGNWQYEGWTEQTSAFGLIGLAALLLVAGLVQGWRQDASTAFDRCVVACVVAATCLWNLFSTLVLGDQTLVYDCFYVMLLPVIALALASAFDDGVRGLSPGKRGALVVVALVVIVFANWFMEAMGSKLWIIANSQYALRWANAIVAVSLTLYLAGNFILKTSRILAPLAMGLSLSATALALQVASGDITRSTFFYKVEEMRAFYRMYDQALTFLSKTLSEKPIVWMASEGLPELSYPVARGVIGCRYEPSFPEQLAIAVANETLVMEAGRTAVVLDGLARDPRAIDAALAKHGFRMIVSAERLFPVDESRRLKVTVGKIEALQ